VNRRELDNLWFSSQPIPGVAFGLNDSVRIKSGEHAGELAAVISLASLEPTPTYIIELGSGGGELSVAESDLESAV
jgi:ribosomal protein L11 methylase PrmA